QPARLPPLPNLPTLSRVLDNYVALLHQRYADDALDLDLREEIDRVFRAPIELGVSLLAAEAAHLRDRHADHADAGERLLDVVQLERLDDGLDLLHLRPPRESRSRAPTRAS